MKTKNLFLSFLSCCVLQVNAQTYMPLLMPGNQWNVMHSFRTTAHEYNYDKTEQLKIVGDTTIGIINYKKLFFTDNEFGDNWALKGFIREDVKERKVYYKSLTSDEVLLYSFNVEVGDTIELFDFRLGIGADVYNIVEAVDYITINNNIHKRVTIRSRIDDFLSSLQYWVEGIGGEAGLLTSSLPRLYGGTTGHLLCLYRNDSLIYKRNDEGCFIWNTITSIFNTKLEKEIDVFVSNHNIVIVFSDSQAYSVRLFDMQGRLLYHKSKCINICEIDKTNLKTGVYLISVQKGNDIAIKRILIK